MALSTPFTRRTALTTTPRTPAREIFGWAMFDFANSSYTTVIVTVVFSVIFPRLVVGDAPEFRLGNLLWSVALSVSYGLVVLTAPLLGASIDFKAVGEAVPLRPLPADRGRDGSAVLREQDRAENVMIVDLLRNDLGKNCVAGSVHVPELFVVESYATVHHLVSTVTGMLCDDKDAIDLLCGAFPGGSITGAPKRRAMEIIEELEPYRRGIYCGAIGYISFDGQMDTNIAIRTMVHREGKIHFWAGGGIVIDSDMKSEFQETQHKAAGMLRLFES